MRSATPSRHLPRSIAALRGLALAAGLLLCLPLSAQSPLAETDRSAIREVIRAQIDAFRHDDAARAFSFASPAVQARFGTPEAFLAIVRVAYAALYRPSAVLFQELRPTAGVPTQHVLVLDADGDPVHAYYPMQRLPDGSWRIGGCFLVPAKSRAL